MTVSNKQRNRLIEKEERNDELSLARPKKLGMRRAFGAWKRRNGWELVRPRRDAFKPSTICCLLTSSCACPPTPLTLRPINRCKQETRHCTLAHTHGRWPLSWKSSFTKRTVGLDIAFGSSICSVGKERDVLPLR